MIYAIQAWSPSQRQLQRLFDQRALTENQHESDPIMAQRKADAFAHRLNTERKLNAEDWQGRIELINHPVGR